MHQFAQLYYPNMNIKPVVDIIAENGEFLVFEVKASADADHDDNADLVNRLSAMSPEERRAWLAERRKENGLR